MRRMIWNCSWKPTLHSLQYLAGQKSQSTDIHLLPIFGAHNSVRMNGLEIANGFPLHAHLSHILYRNTKRTNGLHFCKLFAVVFCTLLRWLLLQLILPQRFLFLMEKLFVRPILYLLAKIFQLLRHHFFEFACSYTHWCRHNILDRIQNRHSYRCNFLCIRILAGNGKHRFRVALAFFCSFVHHVFFYQLKLLSLSRRCCWYLVIHC